MHGYDDDKAKVIARLRRIEGQVHAITQMVEDDKYCIVDADFGIEFGVEVGGLDIAGRSSESLCAPGGGAGR